jgi:tetratricopeptide (TPR) repeat protein
MARLGWTQAGIWKAMIVFHQGRPGEAAAVLDSALSHTADTILVLQGQQNFTTPMALLAGGGGRVAAGSRLGRQVFDGLPLDSAAGPGGLLFSAAELARLTEGYVVTEAGLARSADVVRDFRRMLEGRARGDTVQLRRLVTSIGASSLAAYLISRDTTLLTDFLSLADTVNSSTWRVADAHLALARGDTARARMRVDRHYRQPADVEFAGEQGIVRSYAWGDLLARLGEARQALEAYARLDSADQRVQHPGYLVRSWAERGALHQQLGQAPEAIELYERFIEAWKDADPELQPLVDRARSAVAAIRGELAPNRR